MVQDLLAKSKEQNGSIICAEILGLKGHEKAQSSYVASARTAEYYKSRPRPLQDNSKNRDTGPCGSVSLFLMRFYAFLKPTLCMNLTKAA